LIDLHTHTTASDGRCTPSDLVGLAAALGVSVLSVTDHDTVAACESAGRACRARGITFVPGIEMTAVREGADIHVLGYFIDVHSRQLAAFLAGQRRIRLDRVRAMIERLGSIGIDLDAEAIVQPGIDDPTRAVGRPWIARALVAGGHVPTTADAFDRFLSRGRPAFVPRAGASPEDVIALIHDTGGLASIAHPGLVGRDEWIAEFAAADVDAIESYHPDHDADATARYLTAAAQHGLLVTGGSDFHGGEEHGAAAPGSVCLPRDAFDRLIAKNAQQRQRS
jgi:predicted metal-dependent phosphoesterase TrpH